MKKSKASQLSDKTLMKESAKAGLALVIVAALTLEATGLVQFYFAQKGIKAEATLRAETQLESTRHQIMDVVNQAEAAVRNNVWLASYCLAQPDTLARVAQLLVENNPVVMGSSISMVPGYYKNRPLYAPYVCKGPDGVLEIKSLATEEYDYPSQEWFIKPMELGKGYWSEPYIDEGGGEILMTTFSMPVRDLQGRVAAVLTADLSLDWLTELVGGTHVYPNAFNMVVSRTGQIMVCPAETLIMRTTVQQAASGMEDTTALGNLNRAMLSGQSGSMRIREKGVYSQVFFAPVERTGWSMSIVIPENEIYSGIKRIGTLVTLLQLLGIGLLILILYNLIKNQLKYENLSKQKERMQGELHIASAIQMAMIPKIFPPFPERSELDMSAAIVPAKEVGGDMYDFYIRDEKLFFCIGDVSGKGVPASLVMAVTRSLFRTVSAHEKSARRIVTTLNDSMSESNESNMFVTFFCGILDLGTGHLRYCNAGHNAPLLLTNRIEELPVHPNLPLGILRGFEFQEQEMDLKYDDALFLFTDGLTEAENIHHDLFGDQRVHEVLYTRRSSQGHLEAMQAAVKEFVGEAPQSDDLTMLFIHYTNDKPNVHAERHLILHNDIQQIPQLADFLESIAEEKKLPQSLTMSLNLALEEAVTNVILYAYPQDADGLVDIEAIIRPHEVEFILSDNGIPFDPTTTPPIDISLGVEERPLGGLGMHLVRQIMDSVLYRRDGDRNILTMIKNI